MAKTSVLSKMTSSMEDHYTRDTCGEDYGTVGQSTQIGDMFLNPFLDFKIFYTYEANDGSGNISYFNTTNEYGYKLNGRLVHGDTAFMKTLLNKTVKWNQVFFKAGDNKYDPHIHLEIHDNGNTWITNKDTIQNNRKNKSIVIKLQDAYNKKPSSSSSSSSVYELNQYYYKGWKTDNSIPFKNNDPDLVKEKDTATYGSGAFRLTKDKSGWLEDTRFKK